MVSLPITSALVFTLFSSLVFTAIIGSRFVESRVSKVFSEFHNRTGIQLKIANYRVSFSGITFEDITLKAEHTSVINRVTTKLQLNPFKKDFGRIKLIEVGSIKWKSSISTLQKILGWRFNTHQRISHNNKVDLLNNPSLPEKFIIQSGTIHITSNENNNLVTILGFKSHLDTKLGILDIETKEIYHSNHQILAQVKGQLITKSLTKNYPFILYHQSDIGESWQAQGRLRKNLNAFRISRRGKYIPQEILQSIPLKITSQPNTNWAMNIAMSIPKDKKPVKFAFYLGIHNIASHAKLLSSEPIIIPGLKIKSKGSINLSTNNADIKSGSITYFNGKSRKKIGLKIRNINLSNFFNMNKLKIKGIVEIPEIKCQDLVTNLPDNFNYKLKKFKLSGTLGAEIALSLNLEKPNQSNLTWLKQKWNCHAEKSPKNLDFSQMKKISKEKTPGHLWIDYKNIPPDFINALVASEDAGFWTHKGIEMSSIWGALLKNLSKNQVVMGGSTITMQLAKNLFLSRERTLSRKFQEAILSWQIEKKLTKPQILELYSNLVEFGPEIYGIDHATDHYFGKVTTKINLKQSIWLATTLPAPKKSYQQFCAGNIDSTINSKIENIFDRIKSLGQTNIDLLSKEPIKFIKPNPHSNYCPSEIAQVPASSILKPAGQIKF